MLGCDYCDSIKGIGPKIAVSLIREHKNIETILKNIDTSRYPIPERWPYKDARELFFNPIVTDPNTIEVSMLCSAVIAALSPLFRRLNNALFYIWTGLVCVDQVGGSRCRRAGGLFGQG